MQLTFSAHGIRRPSLLQFVGRESWPRRLLNAMVLAAIAIALAPAAGQAQVPALSERWTLTNVNVVDVENGGILADRAVRIQGGHIAAVVPMDRLIETRGTRRIDARGGYLIPGLYD